ncbi:hypothetical protein HMPREF3213_02773 [Heyndrickxia coagulans]|uniref:Uncharacterized protein n=1 Tax=Heyndrickxia coagulans TaxID=1398 RepID=A0A133KIK7_HEYCO|nr:hypothetical protein HMPREF3213_02773 [Heyndrickxia coagulans]
MNQIHPNLFSILFFPPFLKCCGLAALPFQKPTNLLIMMHHFYYTRLHLPFSLKI